MGSFAAGYLSGGKIEIGLIPLGGAGMAIFGCLLSVPALSFAEVFGLLMALGFSGGFFIVPISALIQHRPDEDKKGGVIAFANWLSFAGVMLASAVYSGFTHYVHIGLRTFFVGTAVASLGMVAYTIGLLPDSLPCLFAWFARYTK